MRLPTLAELERLLIERHLEEAGGDRRAAALTLGISRTRLYHRLKTIEKLKPEPEYRREYTRAEFAAVLEAFAREYQEKS